MMKNILLLSVCIFLLQFSALAQDNAVISSSKTFVIPRGGVVNPMNITQDFFPVLRHVEMPVPATGASSDEIAAIRDQIKPLGEGLKKSSIAHPPPLQGINFEGNPFESGIPNDNDMAISNAGMIVSVINSSLHIYDTTGTLVKAVSLGAFSDTLKLPQGKYDPRALYDPEQDRFVVVCLNGINDSTSFIVVGFSQTNDPTGKWNLYSIPGDPLMDTSWSDYPIIAFTDKEMLLTINALYNDSSWQAGFRQSFIWQIDKMAGYAGTNLNTKLHSGIKIDNRPIRNLCPVQGGSKLTGDQMYFVSNRNFASLNDTIFLFSLTGYMGQSSTLKSFKLTSPAKYGMPPVARQPTLHTFETNDARILDAIIENGKIQFVGNSVNPATGLAGIQHGIISDLSGTPKLNLNILGDPNLDYGYPSIAYAGLAPGDDDALILVNHSSDTVFPGNSVIFYKNNNYSSLVRLKDGSSRVNIQGGREERWGDYSGAQRKYDKPGHVWFAANFGRRRDNIQTPQINSTWISEVKNPYLFQSSIEDATNTVTQLKTFPSPVARYHPVNVKFEIEKTAYLNFSLYDARGRLVKLLLQDNVKPGENNFSFVTDALSPGLYILKIQGGSRVIANERIVVQ